MDNIFEINFDNNHSSGGLQHVTSLGKSRHERRDNWLSVGSTRAEVPEVRQPASLEYNQNPYALFFTISLSPSQWYRLEPSLRDEFSPDKLIAKFNKIITKSIINCKINLLLSFEDNSNNEFIHVHGVINCTKNLSHITRFKKQLRQNLEVPVHNKVALKWYKVSESRTLEETYKYHLNGINYLQEKKSKPNNNIYIWNNHIEK